jgi:hypothetical protein
VRSATGRQHGEIVQGQPGTPGVDSTGEQLAPEHGYDFQVSKLWQGQALCSASAPPRPISPCTSVASAHVIRQGMN